MPMLSQEWPKDEREVDSGREVNGVRRGLVVRRETTSAAELKPDTWNRGYNPKCSTSIQPRLYFVDRSIPLLYFSHCN
jgi:hypothetical protein